MARFLRVRFAQSSILCWANRVNSIRTFVLLFLCIAITGGCSRQGGETSRSGEAAPMFTLDDFGGKAVSLSSLRGGVKVVEFWATWCGPCRESLLALDSINRKFAGRGVSVLAVAVDSDKDDVAQLVSEKGLTLPVLLDDSVVSRLYGVRGIPALFIIGKDGKIVHRIEGYEPGSEKETAAKIEALL
ncbi:MAG: TlpA family protein disulfide reductase [Nitrospirae bacterium]|nr:TlpA family protein disulfide reductase [Nitrospirota bacterium]